MDEINKIGWREGITLRELNDSIIRYMLRQYDGNKQLVAKELGVTQKTIYNRLKRMSEDGSVRKYKKNKKG